MSFPEHPAGAHLGVGRAALWFGTEVEGYHARAGLFTAFLDAPVDEVTTQKLITLCERDTVQQVFLTERFFAWGWFAALLDRLPRRVFFTAARAVLEEPVEATRSLTAQVEEFFELEFVQRVALVVRASTDAKWLHRLRLMDQVSVGVPYDLRTFGMQEGVHTYPSDYAKDKK